MAATSYRIRRWLRNAKDWRNYLIYRQTLKGGEGGDTPSPSEMYWEDNYAVSGYVEGN